MPTMASMTVKKADGTTDIVYDALAASAGDGSPAIWRQDTGAAAGLPVGLRNLYRVWSQWNGPKTARQVKFDFVLPYATQDSTTTLYSARDRVLFTGMFTMPWNIPASVLNEVAQGNNLVAHALMKQSVQSGFSPT